MPFWQFFRKADMELFNPCMKIKKNLGQIDSFDVVHYNFFQKEALAPSMCLFTYLGRQKWMNRIISKRAHAISKILFILGSNKFLAERHVF